MSDEDEVMMSESDDNGSTSDAGSEIDEDMLGEHEEGHVESDEEVDEEEREEQASDEAALTQELIQEGLSMLCKTGDGLSYVLVRFEAIERQLTDISLLSSYQHIRYIDLSFNKLKTLRALSSMPQLLSLTANDNPQLEGVDVEQPLLYLQYVSLERCAVKSVLTFSQPMLRHLRLSGNKLTSLDEFGENRFDSLEELDVSSNEIIKIGKTSMPNIQSLKISGNKLKTLKYLSLMKSLTKLDASENEIKTLDGIKASLSELRNLNLEVNVLDDFDHIIGRLKSLKKLETVSLLDNPVTESGEYNRFDLLVALPSLKVLDDETFNEEDFDEAVIARKQQQLEQEARNKSEDNLEKESKEEDLESSAGSSKENLEAVPENQSQQNSLNSGRRSVTGSMEKEDQTPREGLGSHMDDGREETDNVSNSGANYKASRTSSQGTHSVISEE